MSDFWPVSVDRAADAYAAALVRCQQYRLAASARRAVAAAFDGSYCTKALESKLSALFPGDCVHYYTASYSGDKMLIITRITSTGTTIRTEIRLCRKGEKRISAAPLIESAEYNEQQLASLEIALASFFDNIGQYNTLCSCLRAAHSRVSAVMNCLDHSGSF